MSFNSGSNDYNSSGGAPNGRKKNVKKKMNPILKFALIVFGMVSVFIVIAGMGLVSYISSSTFEEARLPNNVYADTTQKKENIIDVTKRVFERVPERTNFVIAGVDDEGGGMRSDTMIMGSFNSKTKKITLVSVPRDIMVSIPKEDIKEYNALGIYPPSYMKLNEVMAYIGPEYGMGALMKQLENEFGVELDYYVKIDTQGFRDLIDALGGVEMTLTRDYYYYDPDQNLLIDLKAGPQRLMGKEAEGLVRFRKDYASADIKRIEVQQEFMGELFRQTLQRENLVQHAPELLRVLLENVTTNCTISAASKYLQFIPALSSESLEMFSLAGGNSGAYEGPDGLSYYRIDREYVDEVIDEAFYGAEETPPENSKELKIVVLNGSGVSGLAGRTRDMLEEQGYSVSEIGDYAGRRQEKDRIIVNKSGYGHDLKEIFENSEIIVDKNALAKGSDITIVLGTDNKGDQE